MFSLYDCINGQSLRQQSVSSVMLFDSRRANICLASLLEQGEEDVSVILDKNRVTLFYSPIGHSSNHKFEIETQDTAELYFKPFIYKNGCDDVEHYDSYKVTFKFDGEEWKKTTEIDKEE